VAYAAANIASAIPVTPAGLGVAEATMVVITVGFGAAADGGTGRPRLPDRELLAAAGPGGIAYLRLRLRPMPR
jgi:hypothetical protein